jgi:hypothetical protein
MSATTFDLDNDEITIPTSNVSLRSTPSYKPRALDHILAKNFAGAAFRLHTKDAIVDSGVTQIFVMEGTPVINKRVTTRPLKVTLADGHQVMSTHMCDIIIKGLPFMLTGYIIPDLSIASLFGIQVLTKVGCDITLDKHTCKVWYNGNVILTG